MIDLHTHSFLSDGVLIPSELARRAEVAGLEALAITDHADHSNIEQIVNALKKVAGVLTRCTNVFVIAGVELTYVPPREIPDMVRYARTLGSEIVVVHGESPVEPVPEGTNRAAIEGGCDVLAHPGNITEEDALLAARKNVFLEITTRKGHSLTNGHVLETALKTKAKLVLNTDGHMPEDMLSTESRKAFLDDLTDDELLKKEVYLNSEKIVDSVRKAR